MAETKTAEALSQEVKKKDFGIYNQGRIKLNYNEETQDWSEQYEPVKGYKMFIPPVPQQVKLPTDVTVPETPAADTPTTEVTQPATPIVQARDSGESFAERQQREMMERFGPGQDPMQTADRIASIFTPGTEQYSYYKSMGALNLLDTGNLTVNFDQIDEKGGYGIPSLLGGALKFAEKDIIKNTLNKLKFAGILEGGPDQIEDAEGIYAFKVNQDKFDSYVENAPKVADLLRGNREILEQLGKLDRNEVDEFVADMAIGMSDDNTRNVIENALQGKTKGAAAALISFQSGEELDLDKKGFFGNNFYSDQFKEDYNRTMEELQQSQEDEAPKEDKGKDDTRELVAESGDPKAQELLEELDDLLQQKDSKSSGGGGGPVTGTTKPGTSSGGVPKAGTGSSGPPGRNYSSGSSSKSSSSGGSSKSSSSSSGSGTRSGLVSSNKNKSTTSKAPTGTNRPGF
tara:strand:+ start:384 stop:1757 length:1374 start_codon:yes stop_codon:yes gene_type:complete